MIVQNDPKSQRKCHARKYHAMRLIREGGVAQDLLTVLLMNPECQIVGSPEADVW